MKPMLSQYASLDSLPAFPLIVQPKLNGVRSYWKPGDKVLSTREGLPISSCPHIVAECERVGLPWDGELYKHGMSLDDISSAIRKLRVNDDAMQLKLYVFDVQLKGVVESDRQRVVAGMSSGVRSVVLPVDTYWVGGKREARMHYEDMLDAGLEGMIARLPGLEYMPDKRTTYKLKPVWD